ncbi:MAG: hypothetical protein K0A95_07865 [Chromatiales bacterium]|nr:hypothetical protein [Chromatiales bacterium]
MATGEMVSIVLNLLVGIYFAFIYPKSVQKRFSSGAPVPRGFVLLRRVIPKVGIVIIVMTLVYAGAMLSGLAGTANG